MKENLHWFMVTYTWRDRTLMRGWMLATADGNEIITYARTLRYSVDAEYLGPADMQSVTPKIAQCS